MPGQYPENKPRPLPFKIFSSSPSSFTYCLFIRRYIVLVTEQAPLNIYKYTYNKGSQKCVENVEVRLQTFLNSVLKVDVIQMSACQDDLVPSKKNDTNHWKEILVDVSSSTNTVA
jgi:hypothetical protein